MAAMSKSKQSDKKDDGHMKLRVHFTDADAERLEFARSCASGAYRSFQRGELKHNWQVAERVSQEFAEKYPGKWHVIVGKQYGSFVTHEASSMLYFSINGLIFLVFKHG